MATAKIKTRQRPSGALSGLEPLPDPPREIDAMQQEPQLSDIRPMLRSRYASRPDVFVGGEGYLCRYRGQPRSTMIAPDCVAAFGVDPAAVIDANAYVIDEVGKPPDFALEVASKSTGRNDYTTKRDAYARYGVREYWRFDSTGGDYHDAALAGDLLVGGRYEPIQTHEGADGIIRGYSAALELELRWEDGILRLYDPAAGAYLRTLLESEDDLEEAEADLREARANLREARANLRETRVDLRETRANLADAQTAAEEHRAARLAAESEARRLRDELDRLRSGR